MSIYHFPLLPSVPSNAPFATHGRAFRQPLIKLILIGPTGRFRADVVLDTGGEFCLFPEWAAWRIGLRQSPSSPTRTVVSSVSQTGKPTWFQAVDLQVEDAASVIPPFRWTAVVGFTGVGSFHGTPATGILGVNGGLDRFQRIEFDWSALGGPEVVLRT